MQHQYDEKFMGYTSTSSQYAAGKIIPLLRRSLKVASVADIGCAQGVWLKIWQDAGVNEIRGVDGDYVQGANLKIAPELFTSADLSKSLDLGRKFDLVQSLEVAEHIERKYADQFVQNLASHAEKYILFSAAVPGQGGEYHVNEQPYEFWRGRLERHGFEAYDFLRPLILHDRRISFWYRYNCILYVRIEHKADLDQAVRASFVPKAQPIEDPSPLWFKWRKNLVRCLPVRARDQLARLKARLAQTGRF
jgi:hypothetical protein